MSNTPARRRALIGFAGAHARQVPADRHVGRYQDFLRRHEAEAQQAALGGRQQRESFAQSLLQRASDTRNVMLAVEHCISRGQAAGPNGLRPADLDRQSQWALARMLRPLICTGQYQPSAPRTVQIPKGPGRGTRPIRIQDFQDRVVERAVTQVIRPVVEPQYLDCSFGYRPGRSREAALATAERLAVDGDRWIWISQDLKDAFENVPRGRLIQVVRRMIPADDICAFIERLIQQPTRRGIHQGGSMSPELLNIYLHWFLDWWWQQQFPQIPMVRVADDLLFLMGQEEVERVYPWLDRKLREIGMPPKHSQATATRDLAAGQSVEWLGYSIRRADTGIRAELAEGAWGRLGDHLSLAWEDPVPPLSANETILGWIWQQVAAYRREEVEEVYARIAEGARAMGFVEIPELEVVASGWQLAHLRWVRERRDALLRVRERTGLADGYADQHGNSATLKRRRDGARQSDVPSQQAPTRREVYLYTDGCCLRHSRVGGWAYLLVAPGTNFRRADADSHPRTTNNRMEMMAVIRGLESLPEPSHVILVSDSQYVIQGITELLSAWIQNGWRAGNRRTRPLKNKRLWQRLAKQLERHDVECEWVRGHSGHLENEYVDQLAEHFARYGHVYAGGVATSY